MPKGYYRRDRIIVALCNGLLRLASPKYRAMIKGAVRYGMRSAALDSQQNVRVIFDHVKGEVRREPGPTGTWTA